MYGLRRILVGLTGLLLIGGALSGIIVWGIEYGGYTIIFQCGQYLSPPPPHMAIIQGEKMKRLETLLINGDIQEIKAYLFLQGVIMLGIGFIIGMIFMAAFS